MYNNIILLLDNYLFRNIKSINKFYKVNLLNAKILDKLYKFLI